MSAPHSPTHPSTPAGRRLGRGLAVVATAGLLAAATQLPAMAAPGDVAGATSTVHVGVGSAITLTGLAQNVYLAGVPGASVFDTSAHPYTVTTNDSAGYNVTVQAEAATLTASGTADTIPIGNLSVQGDAPGFSALSNTSPLTVASKTSRSDEAGDVHYVSYNIQIPFVDTDSYQVTLDYIATAA